MLFFSKYPHKLALSVCCSIFLLFSCSDNGSSGQANPTKKNHSGERPNKTIPVEVINPQIGTASSYYVTTATLEPNSDAKINARTSGVVRKILREEGDDVKAGELLLQLEDEDQKLRLKQAEQKLASSQREFERLNQMQKAGVVGANEWEAANDAYLTAITERDLAELALSYTKITAPFNGRVVWREVDLGESVTTGNLLMRLMEIKPLLVRVHVPANRIGKVAKGQSVDLLIDSLEPVESHQSINSLERITGVIDLLSPIVDPATGTIKVTVKLDNYPVGVRPGDFTEVKMITDKREKALLLPSVAIIEERGSHYLYVNEAGKAVRKNIQIGYVIGEETEIVSGIQASDKVVIKGQRNLNEGNLLEVMNQLEEEFVIQTEEVAKELMDSSKNSTNNNASNNPSKKAKRNDP